MGLVYADIEWINAVDFENARRHIILCHGGVFTFGFLKIKTFAAKPRRLRDYKLSAANL